MPELVPLEPEQQKLANKNIKLVYFAARKYRHIPEDAYNDLILKLYERLCRCAANFDPKMEAAFSSYTMRSLEGEIKNFFRDDIWMVKPPRSVREKALADESLGGGTVDEEAAPMQTCVRPISIEASRTGESGDYTLEIPSEEELIENRVVDALGGPVIIKEIFAALQPEERLILKLQMDGKDLKEVQEIYKIPNEVAVKAWEELREKVRGLYEDALDGKPLPESKGNQTLTRALYKRFQPPKRGFVDVRKR